MRDYIEKLIWKASKLLWFKFINRWQPTLLFKLTRYVSSTMKHQTDLKWTMDYNTDICRDPDKPEAYYQNSEWNNLNILFFSNASSLSYWNQVFNLTSLNPGGSYLTEIHMQHAWLQGFCFLLFQRSMSYWITRFLKYLPDS